MWRSATFADSPVKSCAASCDQTTAEPDADAGKETEFESGSDAAADVTAAVDVANGVDSAPRTVFV